MKTHEEKSTCSSPRSFDEGHQENAHAETAEGESVAVGGGEEKKVAYRKGQHRPPFKGGEVFGRLTVVSFSHNTSKQQYWHCLCTCGKETAVMRGSLLSKETESCGCLRRDVVSQCQTTHGDTRKVRKAEYVCWARMIQRCENSRTRCFSDYGGRGIKVCLQWRESYETFLKDMGRRPSVKHSIDRIDNDGNYEPSNCKWSTRQEQSCNRRNNKVITYDGRTENISAWASILGISRTSLNSRIRRGWSTERILTTPYRKRKLA